MEDLTIDFGAGSLSTKERKEAILPCLYALARIQPKPALFRNWLRGKASSNFLDAPHCFLGPRERASFTKWIKEASDDALEKAGRDFVPALKSQDPPSIVAFSDSRKKMYTVGLTVADKAKERLMIVQRTPSLLFEPRQMSRILGSSPSEFELRFVEKIEERAREASRGGLLFYYLFPFSDVQREIHRIEKYKTPSAMQKVQDLVRSQLEKWKEVERQGAHFDGERLGFRIDALEGRSSGPLAVNEKQTSLWLGEISSEGEEIFSLTIHTGPGVRDLSVDFVGMANHLAPSRTVKELMEKLLQPPEPE